MLHGYIRCHEVRVPLGSYLAMTEELGLTQAKLLP